MPNPLHQDRVIVLHMYNISDVCGVIGDLLLKQVTGWVEKDVSLQKLQLLSGWFKNGLPQPNEQSM